MTDPTDHRLTDAETTTVMVVDPEILARMVIADYLRECGYRVVEGVTAEDVFVALGAGMKIDIVFADVHLSGDTDGFNLARRVREAYPHIGVILTAGAISASQKASDLCGEGPLNKPYHPHDVINRINILREQRRISKSNDSHRDNHRADEKAQRLLQSTASIRKDGTTASPPAPPAATR